MTDLWRFDLRCGSGSDPREGACLLDAVSWFEYGSLGDHPPCVCPVLAAFGRSINDAMSDAARQRLKPYIFRLAGTVDPTADQARAEYLAWQSVRVFAPLALDAAALSEQAAKLRGLPANASLKEAEAAAGAAWAEAEAAIAEGAAWGTEEAARATWAAARAARSAKAAARATWAAARAAMAAEAAGGSALATMEAARSAKAAAVAEAAIEDAMVAALEGALAIGRQSDPWDAPLIEQRVAEFAAARA